MPQTCLRSKIAAVLNEADTRVKLVDPKLKDAFWEDKTILREFRITVGKVNIFGDQIIRDDKRLLIIYGKGDIEHKSPK